MTPHVAFYWRKASLTFYLDPRCWHLYWWRDKTLTTWNLGPLAFCNDRGVYLAGEDL